MKSMMNATRNSIFSASVTQYEDDPHIVFQKKPFEKGARYNVAEKPRIKYIDRKIDPVKQSAAKKRGSTPKRILTPNPPPHAKPKFTSNNRKGKKNVRKS